MGLFKGMKDSMAQAKEMQAAAAQQMGGAMPGMDASSASTHGRRERDQRERRGDAPAVGRGPRRDGHPQGLHRHR